LLRKGFAGIDRADCTNFEDATRIRSEIGGRARKVDATVGQLIRAGMSTKRLRSAAESGVDLDQFAFIGYSFVLLMLAGDSFPDPLAFTAWENIISWTLVILNITLLVSTGIAWWFSSLDEKIFGALALQKVVLFVTRPFEHIIQILWMSGCISMERMIDLTSLNGILGWALVLGFLVAHVDRVARLPHVGRCLAQFLVARDLSGFHRAFSTKFACSGIEDFPSVDLSVSESSDEDVLSDSSGSSGC